MEQRDLAEVTDEMILNAANHHVGQEEQEDEDLIITAQRESFIWGVRWIIKYLTYNEFD